MITYADVSRLDLWWPGAPRRGTGTRRLRRDNPVVGAVWSDHAGGMEDDADYPELAEEMQMMALHNEMAARQQEMEVDFDAIERIERYGRRFPEAWAGVMFDDDRVVALFTDPEPHRQAIGELVEHPSRVDVRAARRSERELDAIMTSLETSLEASAGRWVSFGPIMGEAVAVELRGEAEALAKSLLDKFGDAVRITLGAHRYPLPEDAVAPAPEPAPTSQGAIPGLTVHAVADRRDVPAGADVTGHVVITNDRSTTLTVFTGQHLDGQIIREGQVVGTRNGFDTLVAIRPRLMPGASTRVHFTAGTDSRDPRDGPTLPPGRYELVVSVGLWDVNDDSEDAAMLVTDPTPITITAQP